MTKRLTKALRALPEHTATRDRDLAREVTDDWQAVDREPDGDKRMGLGSRGS